MARRAVDDYLISVGRNSLLKEHGLHDLRKELLEAALTYYQDFLRQQGDSPGVRATASATYEHVGDIQKDLGRFEEAVAAYDKGLALVDRQDQEVARLRMEASRIASLSPMGRFGDAIASFERTTAAFQDGRPVPVDLQAVLLKVFNAGAEAYSNSGKPDEGLKASEKALEIGEIYTRDHPDDIDALHDLMFAYTYTTHKHIVAGHEIEARRFGLRGIEQGEAILRDHPKDIVLRVDISDLFYQMSILAQNTGHSDQALAHVGKSIALVADVRRENPLLFRPCQVQGSALSFQSSIQFAIGQIAEAHRSADQAVENAESFLKHTPEFLDARAHLGNALVALGKVFVAEGSASEAMVRLRLACEKMESSSDNIIIYNSACAMSIASSFDDPSEPGSSADRQARRLRDAERAIALLRRAIDHGFADLSLLKIDADLNPIRDHPAFQPILRLMEAKTLAGPRAAPDVGTPRDEMRKAAAKG
jgi:eukaryotic-like serine/threonine-protein kinase